MPNILGTSLHKYNKSCSATHQESSKNEFAIFRIFYDFLEILQDLAIWIHYWRCTFTQGSLEVFHPLQLCPYITQSTLKNWGLAILPLAVGGDAAGRNPARSAALPVGERVGLD
jgi:hypothetical protein